MAFFPPGKTQQIYVQKIGFETLRPWFKGYDQTRRVINLITRLRSGHICVGSHFARKGWDLSPSCKCGKGISIEERLKNRVIDYNAWQDLIFLSDQESVSEIVAFFDIENLIV